MIINIDGQALRMLSAIRWEVDGRIAIDEKRAHLLRLIRETNSINAASKIMGVSFKRAWTMLKDMEQVMNTMLVERRRGGGQGGCSVLTPTAEDLLTRYEACLHGFMDFEASLRHVGDDTHIPSQIAEPPIISLNIPAETISYVEAIR